MNFTNWMEIGKKNWTFQKENFRDVLQNSSGLWKVPSDMFNYLFEEIEKQASERGKSKCFSYNFKWKFSKKNKKTYLIFGARKTSGNVDEED